jgi:Zn-dependent protease
MIKLLRSSLCCLLVLALTALAPGLPAYAAAAEVFSGEVTGATVRPVGAGFGSASHLTVLPSVDVRTLNGIPEVPSIPGAQLEGAGLLPELPSSVARLQTGAAVPVNAILSSITPKPAETQPELVAPMAKEISPSLQQISQPKTSGESSAKAGDEITTLLQGGRSGTHSASVDTQAPSTDAALRGSGLSRAQSRGVARKALPKAFFAGAILGLGTAATGGLAAGLVVLPLMIVSFVLHEVAHARTAYLLGDPGPILANRGSLKPRDWATHFDLLWTLILPVATFLASHGHAILGGAKPVEFNSERFEKTGPINGAAIAAFAGPAVNLVLAGLGALAFAGLGIVAATGVAAAVVSALSFAVGTFAVMNAAIAVFNLLPFYPLDGHFIFTGLVSQFSKKGAQGLRDFYRTGGALAWVPGLVFMGLFIKFGLGAMVLAWLANFLLGGAGAAGLYLAHAALPAAAAASLMVGSMRDVGLPQLVAQRPAVAGHAADNTPVDLIVLLDGGHRNLTEDAHLSWARVEDYATTLDGMQFQLEQAGLAAQTMASYNATPVATYKRINAATIRVDASRADDFRTWLKAQGYKVFDNKRRRIIEPLPVTPEDMDPSMGGSISMDEVLQITKADTVQDVARQRWGDPDADQGFFSRLLSGVVSAAVPQPPIAVIDSGADTTHPKLKNVKKVVNVTNGENKDDIGHGTWVTSMVLNFAKWLTNLTHYKTFTDGGASTDDILKALTMAANDGNIVISNSWGSDEGDPNAPDTQLVKKLAEEGHIMVFAAGNAGPGDNTIGSPAIAYVKDPTTGAVRVIAVAAAGRDKKIASFSSRGDYSPATKDNPAGIVPRPDATAVGYNVTGAWPQYLGSLYKAISGTSMSTPDVAGALALLCMLFGVTTKGEKLDAIVKAVMDTLEKTGQPHKDEGDGFLNVEAAYQQLVKTMQPVKLNWLARGAMSLSVNLTERRERQAQIAAVTPEARAEHQFLKSRLADVKKQAAAQDKDSANYNPVWAESLAGQADGYLARMAELEAEFPGLR